MSQISTATEMYPTTAPPMIVVVRNPLEPEVLSHEFVDVGLSVATHLERYDLVSEPVLVLYNSEPLLEADWDTVVGHGDIVTLVNEPGDFGAVAALLWATYTLIAISLATTAYALYTVLTLNTPSPGDKGDSANYSVNYRGNRRRPGEPIPVLYGEMRVWPDWSGQYSTFQGQDQWLYQIFDVTLGETEVFDENDVYYSDTPITAFTEFEIEHVRPGEVSELFPSNVIPRPEVDNIELIDADTFTPIYSACDVGIEVNRLTFHIGAPGGMYWVDDDGDYRVRHGHVRLQYRIVGDTEWENGTQTRKQISHRITPGQFSFTIKVPAGRYECRVARTSGPSDINGYKDKSIDVSNDLFWNGLQATEVGKERTQTTRLAVSIRASQELGNAALSQFNVVARRKIPIWNGSSWDAPTHTKLSCHAFADACSAFYGGKLADEYIDLDHLVTLTDGEFNGIFDAKNTLWNALGDIARPMLGRSIQRPGNIYSVVLDLPSPPLIPIAMFTMRNIKKDSFGIAHNLPIDETVNFVRVTYKDAAQNYRETTIDCVPPGISKNDPYEVTLRGVTNGDSAYSVGIRMSLESLYRRKRITFETTLEGFNVNFMQTIRTGHYQLGLEQTLASVSGEVRSNVGNVLETFEDLSELEGKADLKCYLMDVEGDPWGPVSCTVPDDSHIDLLGNDPEAGILEYSDKHQGPKFAIGYGDDFLTLVKVTRVVQTGEHAVRIEGVEDDQRAYSGDAAPAPVPLPDPDDVSPQVSGLQATLYGRDDSIKVRLSWTGLYADYYIVDMSEDGGATFSDIGRPTEPEFSTALPLADGIIIRVRGVRLFVGNAVTVLINTITREISYPGIYDLRPVHPFTGLKATVEWTPLPVSRKAYLRWYCNSTVIREELIDSRVFTSSMDRDEVIQAQSQVIEGMTFPAVGCRTITARMVGINLINGEWVESIDFTELTMTNDPMPALLNIKTRVTGNQLGISFGWPDPAPGGVFVHLSKDTAYTPNASTLVHFGDSNNVNLTDVLDFPDTYFLRIGGCDAWGPDNVQYSAEIRIDTDDPSGYTLPPIEDSMLHPDLSSRIDLIDADPPGGVVAQAAVTETDVGEINAKYTIKVQADNYVAGYGIIATSNDVGETDSEFFVLADKFYVAHPGASHLSFALEGNIVKMDGARIKHASIDEAQIKDLAVDTLKIQDNAVTFTVSDKSGQVTSVGGNWTNTAVVQLTPSTPTIRLSINFNIELDYEWVQSEVHTVQMRLRRTGNGTSTVEQRSVMGRTTNYNSYAGNETYARQGTTGFIFDDAHGGWATTYTLQIRGTNSQDVRIDYASMTVSEVKK